VDVGCFPRRRQQKKQQQSSAQDVGPVVEVVDVGCFLRRRKKKQQQQQQITPGHHVRHNSVKVQPNTIYRVPLHYKVLKLIRVKGFVRIIDESLVEIDIRTSGGVVIKGTRSFNFGERRSAEERSEYCCQIASRFTSSISNPPTPQSSTLVASSSRTTNSASSVEPRSTP